MREQLQTKYAFYHACISLVHEKGFSKISVKDIVHAAGYNRSTFYLHFTNKFHLIQQLQLEVNQSLITTSIEKYPIGKLIDVDKMHAHSFELLRYIYDNRKYFQLLFIEDTLPNLQNQLAETLKELLEKNFTFNFRNKLIDEQTMLIYMAYGTAGLIRDWIASDFEQSPNELTVSMTQVLLLFATRFVIENKI